MFDSPPPPQGPGQPPVDPAALRGLGDDELLATVERLESARRALDAAEVAALAELEGRGVCDVRFGHRTRDWLGAHHGLDRVDAGRRVRVGRGLRHLGVVAAALFDGRLTLEHARVVVDAATPRVRDVLAGAQEELVTLAGLCRFEEWADHVRALARHADADGGHDPAPERRSLTWGRVGDTLHLRGVLVGDQANTVEHLLDTHADRLFRRHAEVARATHGDLPTPTRPQLRADALEDLVRLGAAAGDPAATVADLTVVIPVDHPALAAEPDPRAHPHPDSSARDRSGRRVGTGELVPRLCDAMVTPLLIDPATGDPLRLGRTARLAGPAQRRAARARDGGCVFPGCDAPPNWCDLHHVVRVTDGGATDIEFLASLCRHHHGVVHRRGWTMVVDPDGGFTITSPRGRRLGAQRHRRRPRPTG
ncbi:MAG: DUF222 domain-containing protein [Microthrixaceae bacterium]